MQESMMADLTENDYPAEATIGDQWARGLRQPQKLAGKPLPSSAALPALFPKWLTTSIFGEEKSTAMTLRTGRQRRLLSDLAGLRLRSP
jgi:hypothetical protein